MNFKIEKYQPQYKTQWDNFVGKAKNATFLFSRDFMEYHNDRFEDFSLMVFKEEKLIAILPANKKEDTIYSHQGLTYGGLLTESKTRLSAVIEIFKQILQFLETKNIKHFEIKIIPSIYPDFTSDELLYILFLLRAELQRRDTLSVVDLNNELSLSKDRKAGVKRGQKKQLNVKETDEFDSFWNEILIPNLEEKHQAKPVHSLEEITLLHKKFPKNIRQFNVYCDGKIVAGTTIFETKNVAHSQYISGNSDKNTLGSLDFLHFYLLDTVFKEKKYFDFGTSNENQGKNINQGLSYWKETFGAHIITQDFYKIKTENHNKLANVLI